ncbi:hypothetical protein GCM10020295_81870 [Streptomyces cinereospinus]
MRAAGLPAPRVVSWTRVLRAGGADFDARELVRVDSPGENAGVDRMLRGAADPTRVEGSARWYARFTAALGGLRGGIRLADPADLGVLFDKRLCHGVLHAAGVPVPASPTSGPSAAVVGGWDDVRELMRCHRMPRLFVKPAHGSSASGVLAVELGGAGRIRATTSVELAPDGRLFNSLKVRRYHDERQIAAVVDTLAPRRAAPGALAAESVPPRPRRRPARARGGGPGHPRSGAYQPRAADQSPPRGRTRRSGRGAACRGGGRRPVDGPARCVRAGRRLLPRTLCVGVDLLPAVDWRRAAVGEVNAFGDLLPRLTGLPGSGAEGMDTYAAQVAAALRRYARGPDTTRDAAS